MGEQQHAATQLMEGWFPQRTNHSAISIDLCVIWSSSSEASSVRTHERSAAWRGKKKKKKKQSLWKAKFLWTLCKSDTRRRNKLTKGIQKLMATR
jgi:hypothetical protein